MDGPFDPPMCLSREAAAWGISRRGDRLSHPDAANLLPAPRVNRYVIVWSGACFACAEAEPGR